MEILENQLSDYRQMLSETRAKIEHLTKERDDARDWIKAANHFAWAHERNCPGYTNGGSHCTCGLDQFLGRPRPYIESWKARAEKAEKDLDSLRSSYAESIQARTN